MEKPSTYITAKVPTMESGSASDGMMVARPLRRNRKITNTTSPTASASVTCTSSTELRIETERSIRTCRPIPAGTCSRNSGSTLLHRVDDLDRVGFRLAIDGEMIERMPLNQPAMRSFSTPSSTLATSSSRTGAPLRQATMTRL